jgi:hypothetical protein
MQSMSNPEGLPIIIEIRDPAETCSQYIFGPDEKDVVVVLNNITKNTYYRQVVAPEVFKRGDIVFYTDVCGEPYHVGKFLSAGTVRSKFDKDPNVYVHELWGEPIPVSMKFEASIVLRKTKKYNHSFCT